MFFPQVKAGISFALFSELVEQIQRLSETQLHVTKNIQMKKKKS